jgi:hypothetical protein
MSPTRYSSFYSLYNISIVFYTKQIAPPGDLRRSLLALSPQSDLPKNIRMLKLVASTYVKVQVTELLDDSDELVSRLFIFDGQKLFWEEITGSLETSLAVECFSNSANNMVINIKDERLDKTNKLTKFTVDKRWTLPQLRKQIKEAFNFNEDFRICKFATPQPELNGDEKKSITAIGVYNSATLVIKVGSPLLPGHFNFKAFLFKSAFRVGVEHLDEPLVVTEPEDVAVVTEPEEIDTADTVIDKLDKTYQDSEEEEEKNNDDDDSDSDLPALVPAIEINKTTFGTDKISLLPNYDQFSFLLDLAVHDDTLVSDLRSLLFQRLINLRLMSESDSVNQVRIRLRTGQSCTDILNDSLTLRQSKVVCYAERQLAVQVK